MRELGVSLGGGRTLHAYDTGGRDAGRQLAVFWHHGTPNIGAPPAPLFATAARLGIRFVAHDRPGYGGSTPNPGRNVGSAAADVTAVADALGIESFAVMGHSGGGPHAIACCALLPGRVLGGVSLAGLAPFGAEGLNWFEGMTASGGAALRAATEGRPAKELYENSGADYDPEFTGADQAALTGEWSWLGEVISPALTAGPGGLIDDDIAYVTSWGCDPADAAAPMLLLHGGRDRVVPSSHSAWLAQRCSSATLWLRPDDGHISILTSATAALEWLRERVPGP